jgi:hypothetical protein
MAKPLWFFHLLWLCNVPNHWQCSLLKNAAAKGKYGGEILKPFQLATHGSAWLSILANLLATSPSSGYCIVGGGHMNKNSNLFELAPRP